MVKIFLFCTVIFLLVSCSSTSKVDYSDIYPATEVQKSLISAPLEKGITIENIYYTKSKDFSSVYFVGGNLVGPGIENTVAIWATNTLNERGLLFSADFVAKEFSKMEMRDGLNSSADGYDKLRRYIIEKINLK